MESLLLVFVVPVLAVLLLAFLKVPLGISMGIVGLACFILVSGWKAATAALMSVPFSSVVTYSLVVLPLFILMGDIVVTSGVGTRAFDAGAKLVGSARGGLGIAVILSSAVFAATSGSSVASAATIGKMSVTEMRRYGYTDAFAGGIVAIGGTLGPMIPPSVILVTYGIITNESIGRLFVAVIPAGLILALLYVGEVFLLAVLRPSFVCPQGRIPSVGWAEKVRSVPALAAPLAIGGVVLLSLYTGFSTVTEAAGIGVATALLFFVFQKTFTFAALREGVVAATVSSGAILLIVLGATIFSTFLTHARVPFTLTRLVVETGVSPITILFIVTLMYLVLGMFMDVGGMLFMTLPFIFPLVKAVGFDPIWFGVYVCVLCEIAVITPPIGLNIYTIKSVAPDIKLTSLFHGALVFVPCELAILVLLAAFPQIATWLPALLFG